MLYPIYLVEPGEEDFVPQVAHPGEDAGADIRACIQGYDKDLAERFYEASIVGGTVNRFEPQLYVDGKYWGVNRVLYEETLEKSGGAVFLAPGDTILVNSGFRLVLPDLTRLGTPWNLLTPYYQIVSRSGLAHKHNIVVTNAPGIVDYGYRDEVKVSLTNRGNGYHVFTRGARIAQGLVSLAVDQSSALTSVDPAVLTATSRDTGGFGSTSV